jgi:nucleoside-diphosphate-sugar epimerase
MDANIQTPDLMLADCKLDPDIQYRHPISPHALAPRAACLTGATGFLGGYLLHELMTTTNADAYCLVRATDAATAQKRLVTHLTGYGLWQDRFAPRVHAIPVHDLADPQFGMADDAYRALAETTDVIYHSAGSLNMAYPYERLKRTNVTGTIEALRLAAARKTKPLHFLSSMVVFFHDAHVGDPLITEEDPPRYHDTLKGGYGKSKWVADRLVGGAMQRGLPATIHRPVRTMGTSATGAMNDLTDILPLVLKACVMLGKCPDFDVRVTMVPVDYVTRAMVHLAGREDSFGKSFHYFHPDPAPWDRMMQDIRSLGYKLDVLTYADWKRALKRQSADRNETKERREFFANAFMATIAPHFLLYPRPPMTATNLQHGLQGTDIAYPPIDAKLMQVYFDYWQKVGFVPRPAPAA